jgi:hypothetical protein
MLSKEEEEIIRIKHLAFCSNKPAIQIRAIDTLAAYGKQAIEAITRVINLPTVNDRVKAYGLNVTEDIKRFSN